MGNWEGLSVTIERIKGNLEDWERMFRVDPKLDKSLKF